MPRGRPQLTEEQKLARQRAKLAGAKPTAIEPNIHSVMENIIDTPEYLGQFFARLLAPENRRRLTEWVQQQRLAVNAVDALMTGRGHVEDAHSQTARA